jgi:signal transduction histidine kinase
MQIRLKILLPFAALLILFISLFSITWFKLNEMRADIEAETITMQKINGLTTQIYTLRWESRNSLLLYVVNQNDEHLNAFNRSTNDINDLLEEVGPLVTSETGRVLLAEFENNRGSVFDSRAKLIEAAQHSNAQAIQARQRVWEYFSNVSNAAALDLMHYHQRLLERSIRDHDNIVTLIFAYQIGMSLILSSLIVVIYYYLNRVITQPLNILSLIAQDITEGNFQFKHHIKSKDEIGVLFNNLQVMSQKLEKYQKHLLSGIKKEREELRRQKEIEDQKNSFLSMASHELKTPITSLRIYAQLIKKGMEKNNHDVCKLYLQKIEDQADRLSRLVTSLLEVAKWQIGNIPFKFSHFNLSETIGSAVEVAQKQSKKHKISLTSNLTNMTYGDEDRIHQVITNLLSNAIRYSPNSEPIEVSITQAKSQVTVSIRDYGIGIEKKLQSKIFDRYYRAKSAHDMNFPGLGIGLYISMEIIKKHHGRIWVKSSRGKGAVFSFTLPLHPIS